MSESNCILDMDILFRIKDKFDKKGYEDCSAEELLNADPFLGKVFHVSETYEWGVYYLIKLHGMPKVDPVALLALSTQFNASASIEA